MKPSPAQLSAFTQAARDRSFSAAARKLGVTQSAVTQHVAALERRMGQPLFIRHRRGLELTRVAKDLFEITDRMIMLQNLAQERIGAYRDLDTGHLQVIANSPRPALPLLARFSARFPKIEISFTLVSWNEAKQHLADHNVDVAIISSAPDDNALTTLKLNSSRFVAHIRADDPLAELEAVDFRALSKRGVILPEEGSLTQKMVRDFAAKNLVSFRPVLQTTTFPVVQEAVLHGAGVGVLLSDSLHPHPMIVQRRILGLDVEIPCSLVTVKERRDLYIIDRLFDEAMALD